MTVTQSRTSATDVFKALASEQRREILRYIGDKTPDYGKTCCGPDEICGCKIVEHTGLAASTVSHHMSILVRAGLVSVRQVGRQTLYSLRRDALLETAEGLQSL